MKFTAKYFKQEAPYIRTYPAIFIIKTDDYIAALTYKSCQGFEALKWRARVM